MLRSAKQTQLLPDRRIEYTAPRRHHLCALAQRCGVLVAILIGTAGAGCSLSRGGSFAAFEDEREVTGSVALASTDKGPSESDMAFARAAASDVLTKGSKDSSQPWENPATGVRGSVTPIAAAYTANGRSCRDFLASFVDGRSESWLQGAACQSERGRWDIQAMKPWKRS